jgi:nitric oxide dioxygenase
VLSEKSIEIVRATLPAVKGGIGEITALFYDKLFASHPSLLSDLFNRGNQANGTQREALAGAIIQFGAALIEQPDVHPEAMLSRIAHKHASLGVTGDQYQVVHTHLFAAIAEVLGEAVTKDVASAWDEVYWLLVEALTDIENRLYVEAGAPDGNTWRRYRVIGRHTETHEVATFLVQPLDADPVPSFHPGQYVSVQVQLSDGANQIRQYSLSGTPFDALQFTVKKISGSPDGEVSNHLHDHIREGDTIRVSAPFGDVTLDQHDNPVLLASAGIGCTPMISMLRHLAQGGSTRKVIAVHADRAPATHAFRAELDLLVAQLPNADAHVWYEIPHTPWPANRTGHSDLTDVAIPHDTTAYLCGPLPFMHKARTQLLTLGIPSSRIHFELFGPDPLTHRP